MPTLNSPAKINLFLQIISRRVDGYHNLASLFQTINLCDRLHFTLTEKDSLTCTDPSIPTDASNLVLKAIDLFRRKTKLNFGLKVHLEKEIPQQAGLGGGSSNAATTLWALYQLLGQHLRLEQIIEWSSEIGSDVPFFLSQGTAYCTGRGEIITPILPLPSTSLWVVKPSQGLSTPQVYRGLDLAKLAHRDPKSNLEAFVRGEGSYYNDLEVPAFAALPLLMDLKRNLLSRGFETVLLSGSGSSFFCLGNGVPPDSPEVRCFQVRYINRAPQEWY